MMGDAALCPLQETGNVGVHERVPDSRAFFAAAEDAGVVEDGEMLGHVLLNTVDSSGQLLDGRFTDPQVVQ